MIDKRKRLLPAYASKAIAALEEGGSSMESLGEYLQPPSTIEGTPDRCEDGNEEVPALRGLIEEVCTPQQIQAMKLRLAGNSIQEIAKELAIDDAAVRGRLERGYRRIRCRGTTTSLDSP
jgi:DNA-binding CsgD family transcriptional regulator